MMESEEESKKVSKCTGDSDERDERDEVERDEERWIGEEKDRTQWERNWREVKEQVEDMDTRIWHSESQMEERCRRKWKKWRRGRDKVKEIKKEGVEGDQWQWKTMKIWKGNKPVWPRAGKCSSQTGLCVSAHDARASNIQNPHAQNSALWWHANKHCKRVRTQILFGKPVSAHRLHLVSLVLFCLHVPLVQGAARTSVLKNVMLFGNVSRARLRHNNLPDSLERIYISRKHDWKENLWQKDSSKCSRDASKANSKRSLPL